MLLGQRANSTCHLRFSFVFFLYFFLFTLIVEIGDVKTFSFVIVTPTRRSLDGLPINIYIGTGVYHRHTHTHTQSKKLTRFVTRTTDV